MNGELREEAIVDAVGSLIEFCKTVDENELSINDLKQGLEQSLKSGHMLMVIALNMALAAVQGAAEKRG